MHIKTHEPPSRPSKSNREKNMGLMIHLFCLLIKFTMIVPMVSLCATFIFCVPLFSWRYMKHWYTGI